MLLIAIHTKVEYNSGKNYNPGSVLISLSETGPCLIASK